MRAANKAAKVSGQMLAYLGQSFEKRERLDLVELCRRNLPFLQASMPGTVVLETDLFSQSPAIMANLAELQQVLINLTTNGWEAIGADRGSLRLSVNAVSPADIPSAYRFPVNWQPQGNDYACLEVTDTGGGIA
jgi:C4-dicarboxylate-specific signal transduction histidine kinase